jgi:predicted site-specific integrase-resolvase
MIPAEIAATVCQCSRRKIYRWIEDGDLHFFEMSDGEVLVCGRSLSQKMDKFDARTGMFSERKTSGPR